MSVMIDIIDSLSAYAQNLAKYTSGRGCYIVPHADEADIEVGAKVRMKRILVGHDVANGEKLQWIVEGANSKQASCSQIEIKRRGKQKRSPDEMYSGHHIMVVLFSVPND